MPRFRSLVAAAAALLGALVPAQESRVRVATYNIKFLDAAEDATRVGRLQQVVQQLDVDVIALQEIDDRAALERVFDPAAWRLVIDDDSGDDQDVALAVRRPWNVAGVPADLDADDDHFVFEGAANNPFFPNRRDILSVEVVSENGQVTFTVMVVHAKSRFGGRATNEHQRVGHARALLQHIRDNFEDDPFVLLGDFNDNPDDASLNILEFGWADAPGGPEQIPGPFILNLAEPLMVGGHVSHGLKSDAINGAVVNTMDAGSRDRNNAGRGTNDNTGDILFDQILIPAWMGDTCPTGSASVFNGVAAVEGNETTRASDHVPVFADFVFGQVVAGPTGLVIAALTPNPVGPDDNNEMVTVFNGTGAPVDLSEWTLRDDDGSSFQLSGTVGQGLELQARIDRGAMLGNGGDTVWLTRQGDPNTRVSERSYTSADATSGNRVRF